MIPFIYIITAWVTISTNILLSFVQFRGVKKLKIVPNHLASVYTLKKLSLVVWDKSSVSSLLIIIEKNVIFIFYKIRFLIKLLQSFQMIITHSDFLDKKDRQRMIIGTKFYVIIKFDNFIYMKIILMLQKSRILIFDQDFSNFCEINRQIKIKK